MILFHTFRKEIQVFIHKPHKLHNTNPVPHCLKMNAPSAHIIVSQPRKAPTYKPAKIDWSTAQEEKKNTENVMNGIGPFSQSNIHPVKHTDYYSNENQFRS